MMLSLMQWGDRWLAPNGKVPILIVENSTGSRSNLFNYVLKEVAHCHFVRCALSLDLERPRRRKLVFKAAMNVFWGRVDEARN